MKQSLETCVATTGLALHFMGLFSAQAQPPSTNTTYAVVDRAADTKTVQSVTTITQPNGYAVRKTNSYVELAPGMHYLENGQWKESRALIEILPGGTGAIAKYGRHKVTFAPDINTDGSIDLTTADGKHLRSHILGLGYYDTASGDVQFIAVVQNSDGLLSGTNQVIYTNAFEGLLADVRYTYRRSGFEQDVILREQPQSPTNFNMNAESTRLVVFTEFLNPPIPIKTTNAIPGTDLVDERLDFGKTKMIRGRAFPLQNVGGQRASVPTAKSWITVDGRTFLIEEVKYRAVEEQLRALPDQSGLWNSKESKNSRIATIGRASSRILAAKKIAGLRDKYLAQHQSGSTMTVASIDLRKAGYVLDYETMDSTATDFTFQPNTTYYIVAEGSGGVVLYGNTTIGDGAVIKSQFDGMYQGVDQYVLYQASGTLTCPTDLQNPAIFTDWCDDSVGAVISGSSGYPNANYPWVLTLENYVTPQLNNLIFKQGMPAVFAYGGVGPIRNCQFVGNTASGVTAQWGNVYLGNVLFAGYCDTALSVLDYGQEVTAENVTAQLYYGNFCPNSDYITYRNCLLAGGTFPGSYSTDTAFGASFESGPMGDFYLPSGSPHRDAGTATIDSQLATDLQSLTTYAPPVYTADTDTPDRGFHYPIVTDSDHDGLPDAWELAHFGALNRDGTGDYDGDGYSDANEFNAGSDPNTIRFYTVFNNLRVNGNTAWGTNTAYKGVPVKMKVLVDNSNLEDGSWTTYSASFSASIGSVEGSHYVWVGLKGSAEDSKPTWARINLIRDTTAPLVVVTNPTASVVFQSLLQLQGYVTEPVQSISFDVANTNGVTTNLSGYVTHQTFNTNTHTLATNWFDCTDIELAEGTNRFTLRVVDRAGNIKTNTVDCTYLLPTNAPVVGVVWPGNGANLSGNAFTIRGTINDVTATVTAEVTTASTTNTATAIIESNGQFWIENLPLGSGNNSIKLTAVDVASNTTVTSFDVVKSSVAVTIDPLSESVLNKPFVNVTGTINVNNHKVWVNGVEATLDNTTWTAQNVPLNSGGTAIVQARAIPTTDNNGNGSGGGGSVGFDSSANPSSASSTTTEAEQDKPPEMVVWYYDESTVLEVTEVYPLPGVGHSLQIYDTHWELGESGHWMADHCFRYLVDEDYFNWTTEWWNKEGLGEQSTGGDVGPGVCGIKDPWTTGTFQVGTSWPLEFCDVSVQGGRETEYADYIASVNSRKAETRIWFHTGGKASVKKKSLFAFSGGASGVGNWFWPDFDDYFPFLVGLREFKQPFAIPNTAVKLGSLGQLDASGQLYRVLGNGKTYDATPIADGYLYYEFGVPGFGKVTPRLNKLTFSAVNQAHFFDVKRDDTAAYYPTPHWETNETTHTVQSSPVLFVSGATVKASDFFLMDVKGSIPSVNLVAKGVASGGETTLKLVGTAGYAGGETWTVTTTAEQSLPANKVDCYKPMHIDWRIAFEGSSEFAEAGENTNHVYVSWHAPTTGNLFHTVVDVACRNAKGKTTEAEIVTGIWGDFTDRSVLKSDGTGPMRYWGEIACTNKETAVCGNAADLVKYADGKCGAWAEFLINTIQVHGLTAVQSTIAYDSYIGPPPTYGYLGNPQRGFYVIDVAGQGGTPCGRKFVNHVVVKSFPGDTNGIYDPSYGNKFSLPTSTESEAAWDDGSVEKFYTLYDLPYPHGDEERTLNNPTGKQVTFTP